MSAILAGLSGPVWGTCAETGIIVDNIEESNEVQETTLQDNQDEHVAVAYTAQKGELTMDFAVTAVANAPARTLLGHVLTIADSTHYDGVYMVKKVARARKRGAWMTGSLTASRFPTTLTTTTTTTTGA